VNDCPSCGHSLGILRAEDARVGALYQHTKCLHCHCKAVLLLVSCSPAHLEMRVATEAEKSAAVALAVVSTP